MSELSPRARALMQQASKGGGPPVRQRQAVRRGVMAAVLVPAVAWAAVAKFVVAGLMVACATAGAIVVAPTVGAQSRVEPAAMRERPINTSAGLGSGERGHARELESLDRSVRALDSEQFAEALAEAREFTRAFPQSQFVTEAQVVEVLALCGLTRFEEARASAARLPPSSGSNPAVRRLEDSCARVLD